MFKRRKKEKSRKKKKNKGKRKSPSNGEKLSGRGRYVFEDGEYEGMLKNNLKHGDGRFDYKNGNCYIGSWHDDKYHGNGIMRYSSGTRYEGEWVSHSKHGHGTLFYSNGDTFVGNFHYDKKDGNGVYYYGKSGSMYIGQWDNDKKHLEGVFYTLDGTHTKMIYYQGELLVSTDLHDVSTRMPRGPMHFTSDNSPPVIMEKPPMMDDGQSFFMNASAPVMPQQDMGGLDDQK